MQFKDVIDKRRSIRAFTDKKVEDAQIMELLAMAHKAPSGGNLCPWEFIIIRDQERLKAITENTFASSNPKLTQAWIATAPVIVVVCGLPGKITERYGNVMKDVRELMLQDIGAVVENFLLGAVDMGLASCWVVGFHKEPLKKLLALPEGVEPTVVLPLGYGANEGVLRPRPELAAIVHRELYGSSSSGS